MLGLTVSIHRSFESPRDLELSLYDDEDRPGFYQLGIASMYYLDRPGFECMRSGNYVGLPTRYISLPAPQVAGIVELIQMLQLPAFPPFTAGLDGESYEVKIVHAQSRARWEWWGDVPQAWAPLGELVQRLLALSASFRPENSLL
jgi:hypothetical protein